MTRILVFELLLPPYPPPLVRRVPGEALDALPMAPLLKRAIERDPPDTEIIERVLDALRGR